MQALPEPTRTAFQRSNARPRLDSCDSGEEFSFLHWIQVCRLVDESGLEETLSKVESPATNQNLAGHVV